jgi:Ca-activated chloride channel family protein
MSKHNGDQHKVNRHASNNGATPGKRRVAPETLTAYALRQLSEDERAATERLLADPDQSAARQTVAETERLAGELASAWKADSSRLAPATELREAVLQHIESELTDEQVTIKRPNFASSKHNSWWGTWILAGGLACVAIALSIPAVQVAREHARRAPISNGFRQDRGSSTVRRQIVRDDASMELVHKELVNDDGAIAQFERTPDFGQGITPATTRGPHLREELLESSENPSVRLLNGQSASAPPADLYGRESHTVKAPGIPIPDVTAAHEPANLTVNVDRLAQLSRHQSQESVSAEDLRRYRNAIKVANSWQRSYSEPTSRLEAELRAKESELGLQQYYRSTSEQYSPIVENPFLSPLAAPLSTFSIDIDTASYANVRRFLSEGRLPPADAVRIEELVNYFQYSYPQPTGREPFSVNMEAAECPWNAGHLLLRVGLKGKEIDRGKRPPSNLVFLIDVSGSMSDENKLPLVKTSLRMLVGELTEDDRVSIVTYAGEAGLRLPPTRGHDQDAILAAIDSLSAGGSTHGSAGIQLAYEQAAAYFVKEGTNRVILATDGDLNVGVTSDDALVELIKTKAAGGTFLTVLGFGTGNLKDGKLEKLADNGNGVYAYVDSVREARKVLVEELSGSLVTIAKDVKIQIEFNPAQIASYRLLGYENRVLAAADFHDDKKDAGEIGAGHAVTALYELVPVGAEAGGIAAPPSEPLRYQQPGGRSQEAGDGSPKSEVGSQKSGMRLTDAAVSGELLTLKLRYKEPEGVESRLVEFPLKDRGGRFGSASPDLQFAAAVASFGMLLRGSEHAGTGNMAAVAEIAASTLGHDPGGYRAEFVDLARKAQSLEVK